MIKVTKESFYKTIMTARAYNMKRREVDHTELKVGDMVDVLGWKRIVAIRPYRGPHRSLGCFAIADTVPGVGFSLWSGQMVERVDPQH